MLNRRLYTALFFISLPFALLRLYWRSLRLPAYRQRIPERLGFYPFKLQNCIWVHAVSVGETIASAPMIVGLMQRYPNTPLLITNMTPTGAMQVKTLFGDKVHQVYLPYDLPYAINRFLDAMYPRAAVMMETELWPNLLAACRARHIPVCLLNARLSERSAQGYQRIANLTKEMLRNITVIAANGKHDAERFIALGASRENVMVTGNIKFDLNLDENLSAKIAAIKQQLGQRFVWIAASTHEGEEAEILAAHKQIRMLYPDVLLLLVPRHPDRFEQVAAKAARLFKTKRRSLNQVCDARTAVYMGDTMGELMAMYGAADVVFVGGSLIARGGHNMLEPAALNKPILVGPHLFNFADISELLLTNQAMIKVQDAESIAKAVIDLYEHADKRQVMGKRAWQVVQDNKGALARQLAVVASMIG